MIASNPQVPIASSMSLNGKRLAFTNLNKPLYASGFTKGQAIAYYLRIAPVILAHLRGRAATLKRFPSGTRGPFFFEKNCPIHRPDWVKTARIHSTRTEGKEVNHCLIADQATLAWVANLAALELHVPLAKANHPDRPTVMVFDLDPGAPATLADCLGLGLKLRDLLERLGLQSFAKTSGSKGLHVYVPLNSTITFEQTKTFALAVASLLAQSEPARVTVNMNRAGRAGKVFMDWSQNDAHKTTVCAYSLRAKDEPMVSTPVSWEEVERGMTSAKALAKLTFAPQDVVERLDEMGDLFAPVLTLRQRLPRV